MAHESLVSALQDQHQWEARAAHAKELQTQMLASRREAAELAKQYDIRPVPHPKPGEVRAAWSRADVDALHRLDACADSRQC